ncbi:MAG: hypothetical protein PWR03_1166 [Tenuifilum sp.]|jgi:hypothetical protein|uniref:IPExxxVDY family protein n=1 Tax=Tenuifilum thalassicum TaxID=2590900 RepID=A0A7D4BEI6_9BACT|nr:MULTISPECIES: IPExxxVDY family protein [Tenuifilum]MDI3526983.1 hypothetical protein [Tenuifilum sp.]QKG80743.1 IPExxxVDY family protein [Tenuifilum thalassicum]
MAASRKQKIVDEPTPFKLLAIASSLSISQMAWHASQNCHLSFKQNTDIEEQLGFPAFTDRETYSKNPISLIGNKSNGKVLFPKISNIDYILEVTGECDNQLVSELLRNIRSIHGVQAVVELDAKQIKRKEPFCTE